MQRGPWFRSNYEFKGKCWSFFSLPRLNCTGTKCYVCLFKILFTPGVLRRPCGGDGVSFNMLHSCPVSARNQTPLLFLLSYLRLKRRKKELAGVLPLGATEIRNEERREWELKLKEEPTYACRDTSNQETRTCKRLQFDTYVWECVARSHRQRCYRQCKHVWRCVLNTHYRGLGKLWERLGEKTNKPHRVFERGGKGSGGFSRCNSSSITDLSPQSNSGFSVLLRQITCAVTSQLWILYTSTEALSERERALKTTKGQFGMSIINQVLLNIKWQHRWQDPNPSTFWYDVKKPGPHRALSQPGSRRHHSPAWPQLGQFRSERTSLPACQNDQRKKTRPRQTSGKHWWLLSLHLYADVEDCLCFGSQTATILCKFLCGKNTCTQANAKYKLGGKGGGLKLTDNKQTELLPLLISIQ